MTVGGTATLRGADCTLSGMRKSLMEILCCPVCKGDLELKATKETDELVLEGSLSCAKCPDTYPIEDGIPNLLPKDLRNQ